MQRCARCGGEVEVRQLFCPHCSAQMMQPHWSEYTSNALFLCGVVVATPIVLASCYWGLVRVWPIVEEIQNRVPRSSRLEAPAFFILVGALLFSLLLLLATNKLFKK